MGYSGMSTTIKKWVEMKMKMTINLYGKGNEVVFLCMFYKWSCFFLNSSCQYMQCYGQRMMYHIQMSWINYDNVC
jgi:hypothetical protein